MRFVRGVWERVGHQTGDTETYIRQNRSNVKYDVLVCRCEPANNHLAKLYAEHFRRVIYAPKWLYNNKYFRYCFEKANPLAKLGLTFRPDHTNSHKVFNGSSLLPSLPTNNNLVCYHLRDDKYDYDGKLDNDKHRNGNIKDYELTLKYWLNFRGYEVVRVGKAWKEYSSVKASKHVESESLGNDERFIHDKLRSCKYFLGDNSGPFIYAVCLGRPCAVVNYIPISYVPLGAKTFFILKKYEDVRTGRLAPYKEVLRRGVGVSYDDAEYLRAGLRVVNNSADEILELVKQVEAYTEGKPHKYTARDKQILAKYRRLVGVGSQRGFKSTLGRHFIRKYAGLFV